ncbi:MAG: hypothetical protein LIO86_02165 [Lachnospiraceae bacterium]|nr:hypothetical protein [Lachnospiraceae bacterium]
MRKEDAPVSRPMSGLSASAENSPPAGWELSAGIGAENICSEGGNPDVLKRRRKLASTE